MSETTPQPATNSELTAAQAADVIRYYHAGYNSEARARGWKDKVSLGQTALRTSYPLETLLEDGVPMLTKKEMYKGLDHILRPPKSDRYYDKLDEIVDKRNVTYDDARRILDNDGEK